MVDPAEVRREVLDILWEQGLIVGVAELEKILAMQEPARVAMLLSKKFRERILTLEDIESVVKEASAPASWSVEPIINFSPLDLKCGKPSPDVYASLFSDRYRRIKKIFIQANLKQIMPIKTAKKIARRGGEGTECTIVGIVNDVVRAKASNAIMLEIEDDSGERTKVIVQEKIGKYFIRDAVLAFRGRMVAREKEDCFYASEVILPDIPVEWKGLKPPNEPCALLFISDIHFGSRTFLYEAWEAFISWLKSSAARDVRYLIVAGDLVDGIGVYPGQEEELEIDDIYEQYRELGKWFSCIPEHIKIIVIPGNHDAVRQAEPQPPLAQELKELLGKNVLCYSNPAYLNIQGVKILIYHGRSFDDLVEQAPGYLSYSKPTYLMRELIRLRHLAPTYGGKTPIAPLPYDGLVIEDVPDIFVAGHVHTFDVERYRGTLLINASTWQSQTEFQKQINIVPNPAKVYYFDLSNQEGKVLSFI